MKQVYITDDGKTFQTEKEAVSHEKSFHLAKSMDDAQITRFYNELMKAIKAYVKTYGEVPSSVKWPKAVEEAIEEKHSKTEAVKPEAEEEVGCEDCPNQYKKSCLDTCPYIGQEGVCCMTQGTVKPVDNRDPKKEPGYALDEPDEEEEPDEEDLEKIREVYEKALNNPEVQKTMEKLVDLFKFLGVNNCTLEIGKLDDGDAEA